MKSTRFLLMCSVILLGMSALPASADSVSLNGTWTLDYWEQKRTPVLSPEQMQGIEYATVQASVPGNVELDLLAAGLVADPETGSNVYLLRPFEGYQWRYSRSFVSPEYSEEDELSLRFGGIDCYAEIYLNGVHVGSSANMLIEHEYDVTDVLAAPGEENRLEVYIRSSVIEGRGNIPPAISYNFAQIESVYSRRAPHTYGWDIMPRLVSAGLWRDVTLEVRPPVHIVDAHWYTAAVDIGKGSASVYLDYTVTLPVRYQDGRMTAEFTIGRNGIGKVRSTQKITSHSARVMFGLEDVDFWWPRGYGDAALYDATVRILDENGREVDSDSRKIGIRTVRLDMTGTNSEEAPGRFCFIVNGEKIYVHGSNWTPMDAFHSRDPQHLEKAFAIARDLNCNMLRCWGGNVYEDHAFFDLCDAEGIMVWQDFAMGCTLYPQDPEFQKAIAGEVRSVVIKLRSHPSLVLWAGNNENDQTLTLGTLRGFRMDPNDDVVSRVTIPSVLYEYDPTRPYLPSSPYWSEELVSTSYSTENIPEDHLWGPRGYYKDPFYTGAKCIFVSEIGYHGMPCRESLEKMFPPESVYPWSDVKSRTWKEDWLTKSVRIFEEWGYTPDRNNLMINQVRLLFGDVPADLDDFIFASQSVQAEAMKYFIEKFRGHKFEPNTGMLWWNIRDGWPLISDAIVDWYNNPKMAYWFIKNAQTDVCVLMNDAIDGSYPLVVANDTRKDACGKVTVTDVRSGQVVFKGEYAVAANGRQTIARIPEREGQGIFKIAYTGRDGENLENHYLYGKAPYDLKEYRKLLKQTNMFNVK
ncbi:MAG: glycoside hydrolase family 2 protein [Candidatus Cryptobacteroides sp.]